MGAEEQEEEEEEQEEPQQQEEGICSVRACGGERGGRAHAIPCEYGEIGALNDEYVCVFVCVCVYVCMYIYIYIYIYIYTCVCVYIYIYTYIYIYIYIHAIPSEDGEIGALNDEAAFEEDSRQQRHDGRHGQVPQYQAHPLFDCRRLR